MKRDNLIPVLAAVALALLLRRMPPPLPPDPLDKVRAMWASLEVGCEPPASPPAA